MKTKSFTVRFNLPFVFTIEAESKEQAIAKALTRAPEELATTPPSDWIFSEIQAEEL